MKLSQQQLNTFSICPRRFQHIYLDQLLSPLSPEQEEKLAWGHRFHLLMQQRELGLPIDSLIAENSELSQNLSALLQAAPELFNHNSNEQTFREAEHQRTVDFQDHLLIGVYDLFITDAKTAQIIDWKTYPRPQKPDRLIKNWQTRIYLYLLVESSDYLPEQVSMTYWFVKGNQNSEPQFFRLDYNEKQHQQTQQDLRQLITQLEDNLQRYYQGEPFPQVNLSKGECKFCSFAPRCQRLQETDDQFWEFNVNQLPNLAKIEEIPI